jgi:hypothetical protein
MSYAVLPFKKDVVSEILEGKKSLIILRCTSTAEENTSDNVITSIT